MQRNSTTVNTIEEVRFTLNKDGFKFNGSILQGFSSILNIEKVLSVLLRKQRSYTCNMEN